MYQKLFLIATIVLFASCSVKVIEQNDTINPLTRAGSSDLNSEYALYEDPSAPFYSTATESLFFGCPSATDNSFLMEKYDFEAAPGEDPNGSPHPNATLAAEGYTLLNACEFHAIDGWSYSRSVLNEYGVHPVKVENGWGAQNTVGVEKSLFVNNEMFTNVTNEGYLRMWACPYEGLTEDFSTVYVGGAGCYANKVNATAAIPQNTPIGEGTRVEIRARLCGEREGFLLALWLQGNATELTWPEYGEIDIMENHVNIDDSAEDKNTVYQTLHWGSSSDDSAQNPSTFSVLNNVEDWNIYWVEITDATTVKMGINGETTMTVTNSNNDPNWPFCNSFNPSGFHILLDLYAGWNYPDGSKPSEWGTNAFQNMSYAESITSDVAPRIEIDWIRYWKNDNYDYSTMYFPFDGNNRYAHMY